MPTDNRDKRLKRIRVDLAMWQSGQPTPAASAHLLAFFYPVRARYGSVSP